MVDGPEGRGAVGVAREQGRSRGLTCCAMTYEFLEYGMRAPATLPFDIAVALRLVSPAGTLVHLAHELAVVPSQVHAAMRRLDHAGLLRSGTRSTNVRALADFVVYGIRYVFPARRGALGVGIPTAYSAPPLATDIDATDAVVWPAPGHPLAVQGFTMIPLYSSAPSLVDRSPSTYTLLTLVDAFRLGDPRVRPPARERLEAALGLR